MRYEVESHGKHWLIVNRSAVLWDQYVAATISNLTPDAGKLAYDLCDKLNQQA